MHEWAIDLAFRIPTMELDKLTGDELQAELDRSLLRLTIAPSTKVAMQWQKRIHRLEAAVGRRA